MSMITLVTTCLCFVLVSSSTWANEANVNCLRTIKSQVEDPNGYLSSWNFANETEGFVCKFNGVSCWDEKRVMSIQLSGYGLKGGFPLGIRECSDLTGLDLSRNNFSGPLPSNIFSLIPFVTVLDLSYNQFSGEIPASLSNITYLNNLMLRHNQFTGQLPPQLVLLRRLRWFSVADNLLTGPVPNFEESLHIGPENYANNLDLCGKPLDACVDREGEEEEMIPLGKMGAAIGAALLAPVGAFLGWFFFNGSKEKQGVIKGRNWIYHIGD
ncbi:PREDICTED: probably inactive leucine-rich repeat receptor-like protein kinase At5g48380 [Camelina sativa]|uniref:Probably inactive leucine-rich repeat receptor-like protein kinase At5g48380 n=1 Tax=Camelina sativa TaxID=90675 RepID=A0ABM0TCD5_CAMSA|nr:PREDICTED: probably inactive leucine-rich repeat receptor-like protein kinase At5g48380 [Camelina sativa]